jgi:hypothetical protein
MKKVFEVVVNVANHKLSIKEAFINMSHVVKIEDLTEVYQYGYDDLIKRCGLNCDASIFKIEMLNNSSILCVSNISSLVEQPYYYNYKTA